VFLSDGEAVSPGDVDRDDRQHRRSMSEDVGPESSPTTTTTTGAVVVDSNRPVRTSSHRPPRRSFSASATSAIFVHSSRAPSETQQRAGGDDVGGGGVEDGAAPAYSHNSAASTAPATLAEAQEEIASLRMQLSSKDDVISSITKQCVALPSVFEQRRGCELCVLH
jgi:hypothetical protein